MTDPKAQDWKERFKYIPLITENVLICPSCNTVFPLEIYGINLLCKMGCEAAVMTPIFHFKLKVERFLEEEIAAAEERGRQQGRQEISQQLYPGTIFQVAIVGEYIERGVTPVYFGDDGKVYKSEFPPANTDGDGV